MKKYLALFLLLTCLCLISCAQNATTFTASGTYAVPANVTSLIVECWAKAAPARNVQ